MGPRATEGVPVAVPVALPLPVPVPLAVCVGRDVRPARRATRPDPCGVTSARCGRALCFGASTVILGSWAPEPVAVCDIAVPLRLLSTAADRIAIAEDATEPDDDLMIMSFRARTELAAPMHAIPRKLVRISGLGYSGLQYIFGAALDIPSGVRRPLG
jgi:hypothetical protein